MSIRRKDRSEGRHDVIFHTPSNFLFLFSSVPDHGEFLFWPACLPVGGKFPHVDRVENKLSLSLSHVVTVTQGDNSSSSSSSPMEVVPVYLLLCSRGLFLVDATSTVRPTGNPVRPQPAGLHHRSIHLGTTRYDTIHSDWAEKRDHLVKFPFSVFFSCSHHHPRGSFVTLDPSPPSSASLVPARV
jgi:hypothetical protein